MTMNAACPPRQFAIKLTVRISVLTLAALTFMQITLSRNSYAESNKKSPQRGEAEELKTGKEDSSGFFAKAIRKLFQQYQVRMLGSPHTINALPIVFYGPRTGVNLGFNSVIHSTQDYPYLYRLKLQVIASLRGSHRHKLLFEYPHLGRSNFGLILDGEWERDLEARYFGLGNDSVNEDELTDPQNQLFIDENYYLYNLKRPRITLYGTREMIPNISLWFGFGLESVDPQIKNGPATSFLAGDRPFGHLGGSGRHFSLRLRWDTRINDVFPLGGFLTEIAYEPNFASVKEEVAGANETQRRSRGVTFQRYTFSDAHFIPLLSSNHLIFANRVAFEAIAGEPPFYALGEIAGEPYTRALGGGHSLRGFQSRRFHDKIKFFTLTELRYNCKSFHLTAQTFDLILVGFFDTGRVWHRWSEISFDHFHSTVGLGVWLNWNHNLIIRLDVGRSSEEIIPFFRLNSAF